MLVYVPLRAEAEDARQPWGTIALFSANVLVALIVGCWDPHFGLLKGVGIGNPRSLMQPFGEFAPWTWITGAFVHADIAHLAGNMAFLLAFGMVVERIIGAARLLGSYFAIAIVAGLAEQILTWGDVGSSGGASGCIFGLMTMALVWAPRRRLLMGYWVWRHVGTTWMPVSTVAIWFVGLNLAGALLTGFMISSSTLHVLGAVAGLLIAVVAMQKDWVDTGGEDWLSIRRAERERVEALPGDPDPLRHVVVPQYTAGDHLHSFASFMLPVAAAIFTGWGFVTIWLVESGQVMAVLPKALLFEAIGVGLFLWWRYR